MFEVVVNKAKFIDSSLSAAILKFLEPYYPAGDIPYLVSLLPFFVRIIIYAIVVLTPLVFLKFLYPYETKLNWLIIALLVLIAISVAGIFFGFFQLLYS